MNILSGLGKGGDEPKKVDSSSPSVLDSAKETAAIAQAKVSTATADALHATTAKVGQAEDYLRKTTTGTTEEKPSGAGGVGEYVQKAKDFVSNPLGGEKK